MATKKKVAKKRVTKKKATKKFDALEGFRARTDEDEQNEELIRSIRGLSSAGINVSDIALVIDRDEILKAINEDGILKQLVHKCSEILRINAYEWSMADNPEMTKDLHLESRAARIVIDWIEGVIQMGNVAEQLIAQDDERNEDD